LPLRLLSLLLLLLFVFRRHPERSEGPLYLPLPLLLLLLLPLPLLLPLLLLFSCLSCCHFLRESASSLAVACLSGLAGGFSPLKKAAPRKGL
jgi:hypothetical protein